MNTRELDKALMQQFSIESMLKPSCNNYKLQPSSNSCIAAMQEQAYEYCFKSKGFLCSHYVDSDTDEGKFSLLMKLHMMAYIENDLCKRSQVMKYLYSNNIDILFQQISLLALHSQFKDVDDIHNVDLEIQRRSLSPDSVSISIGIYVYYTILINDHLDALSYNELFIKSWYYYYDNWMAMFRMLKMNGNNWKRHFKGCLLE